MGDTSSENLCGPRESEVYMPVYGLYLIGFSMLLLFLIILYLIYLLMKSKSAGPTYKPFTRQESNISGRGDYCKQSSVEKPPVVRSPTLPIIQCESIIVEESLFKPTSARDLNQNQSDTLPLTPKNEPKINPLVKSHLHPNSLLPEQMRQICKEALEKKMTLKEIDEIQRRPSFNKSLVREKSASTPQLDVYDTLPAPMPTIETNEAKVLDEPGPRDKTDTKEEDEDKPSVKSNKRESMPVKNEIQPNSDEIELDKIEYCLDDDDIPLYDSPPAAAWKTRVIEENEYLSPICTTPVGSKALNDPSYINAKRSDFIL